MGALRPGGGGGGASLSDATPQPTGTAAAGVSTSAARADHVHAASVAAASITDAGAVGVDLVQAATAAEARTAVRSDLTATYDFSSATGVTTTNGSAGGTAAVSGGVLALTCPATPAARYYSSFREAPRGSVALPLVDGRYPLRWRATARLKSLSSLSAPRFLAKNVLASTLFVGFYIGSDGSIGAENNSPPSTYASAGGFPLDGTGWLEIECSGDLMVFRYGTGTTSTEPSTWTILATASQSGQVFGTVELVNSTNSAPGSTKLVEWDDLTVSSW